MIVGASTKLQSLTGFSAGGSCGEPVGNAILSDENRIILQYVKSGGEGVFTIVKKMTQYLSEKTRKIEKKNRFSLHKRPV